MNKLETYAQVFCGTPRDQQDGIIEALSKLIDRKIAIIFPADEDEPTIITKITKIELVWSRETDLPHSTLIEVYISIVMSPLPVKRDVNYQALAIDSIGAKFYTAEDEARTDVSVMLLD